jgi:hypothetical protein
MFELFSCESIFVVSNKWKFLLPIELLFLDGDDEFKVSGEDDCASFEQSFKMSKF